MHAHSPLRTQYLSTQHMLTSWRTHFRLNWLNKLRFQISMVPKANRCSLHAFTSCKGMLLHFFVLLTQCTERTKVAVHVHSSKQSLQPQTAWQTRETPTFPVKFPTAVFIVRCTFGLWIKAYPSPPSTFQRVLTLLWSELWLRCLCSSCNNHISRFFFQTLYLNIMRPYLQVRSTCEKTNR